MARRASSGLNSTVIIAVVGAALALGAIAYAILNRADSPSIAAQQLPIDDYISDANSFYDSVFAVEGEINEKFPPHNDGTTPLSLNVGSDRFILIALPADHGFGNINVRQRYAFEIRIGKGGVATAQQVVAL